MLNLELKRNIVCNSINVIPPVNWFCRPRASKKTKSGSNLNWSKHNKKGTAQSSCVIFYHRNEVQQIEHKAVETTKVDWTTMIA